MYSNNRKRVESSENSEIYRSEAQRAGRKMDGIRESQSCTMCGGHFGEREKVEDTCEE
jgi:hypothetical protein